MSEHRYGWLKKPKKRIYTSSLWRSEEKTDEIKKKDIGDYKKPLSNKYSDDYYSDYSNDSDEFDPYDSGIDKFENNEEKYNEFINESDDRIKKINEAKREKERKKEISKELNEYKRMLNRPPNEHAIKRDRLREEEKKKDNKKGGNKKNNKNLVYMSGSNPFAKLRQLLSSKKSRKNKRFSNGRMGSRRRGRSRRRMGSR